MIPWRNLNRLFQKSIRQPGYAFGVIAKRLRAYEAFLSGRGQSSAPEALTLFLTHACNLHCRMCGQWGDAGVHKNAGTSEAKDWLSADDAFRVIDEVALSRPSITLFGGEPFLHPQFLDIAGYVKKRGLHGVMITNGTLLTRFAKELVAMGWDELNISIDGGKELQDAIRGVPGVFDAIMEGIDAVNAAKKEAKRRWPLINIQCTISRYNAGLLKELVEVARRARAASLTFHNLIFLGRDILGQQKMVDQLLGCSSAAWEGFVFEAGIDPEALDAEVREILKGTYPFAVDLYPNFSTKGLREYYQDPNYMPSDYARRCLSPWLCAYIFPDGSVRPCLNCTFSFGNVKEASFDKIWNSAEAVRYRTAIKKEGLFPVCRRCTELYRY